MPARGSPSLHNSSSVCAKPVKQSVRGDQSTDARTQVPTKQQASNAGTTHSDCCSAARQFEKYLNCNTESEKKKKSATKRNKNNPSTNRFPTNLAAAENVAIENPSPDNCDASET
jgi:hypothetical protein